MENEKRLINADVFWEMIDSVGANDYNDPYYGYTAGEIYEALCKTPTVDAVEVVHGRWILEQEFEDGTADYKCSACDYDDTFHRNLVNAFYNYCPYCGAKMDGDGNG